MAGSGKYLQSKADQVTPAPARDSIVLHTAQKTVLRQNTFFVVAKFQKLEANHCLRQKTHEGVSCDDD